MLQYSGGRYTSLKKRKEKTSRIRQIHSSDVYMKSVDCHHSYPANMKKTNTNAIWNIDVSGSNRQAFLPYYLRNAVTRKTINSPSSSHDHYLKKLPTKTVVSPYAQHSHFLYEKKSHKSSSKKFHHKCDARGLEQCYKRVCNDDGSSFRLLLRNQDQFGKQKIPLQVRPDDVRYHNQVRSDDVRYHNQVIPGDVRYHNILVKKAIYPNSFPRRKPPHVPVAFMTGRSKKRITANFEVADDDKHTDDESFDTKTEYSIVVEQSAIDATSPSDDEPSQHVNPTIQSPVTSDKHDKNYQEMNLEDSVCHENYVVNIDRPVSSISIDPKTIDEINQEVLRTGTIDDDFINVPTSSDFFTDSRCSSSASRIIENHIKEHRQMEEDVQVDVGHMSRDSRASHVSDGSIVTSGAFIKCEIDMNVIDENGENNEVEVFMPDLDVTYTTDVRDTPKPTGMSRKEKLAQLLNECSQIAKEINDLELQS